MRRQAYINWERVTEENKPESGKDYLVAEIVNEKVAMLGMGTWYNKGDLVEIPSKADDDVTELSVEERLLRAIFGYTKTYTVPEDGFYKLTGDYGIDKKKDNGFFENCEKDLIPLEKDIFFAEQPLVPEGYVSKEQNKAMEAAKMKQLKKAYEEEAIAEIRTEMDNNTVIKETVECMVRKNEKVDISFSEKKKIGISMCAGIYEMATADIAKDVITASHLLDAVMVIACREGSLEKVMEDLEELKASNEEYHKYVAKLMSYVEVPDRVKAFLTTFFQPDRDNGFYYFRNKFAHKNKTNPAYTVIRAKATCAFFNRVLRNVKLRSLNAPEIILVNELRMLTELMIAISRKNDFYGVTENFPAFYGILQDGTKYEGLSDSGNWEQEIKYEEETGDEETEDKSPEPPEDKYIVAPSPTYLLAQGYFSLWNEAKQSYYREGQEVLVFTTWKECKDKAAEVNG